MKTVLFTLSILFLAGMRIFSQESQDKAFQFSSLSALCTSTNNIHRYMIANDNILKNADVAENRFETRWTKEVQDTSVKSKKNLPVSDKMKVTDEQLSPMNRVKTKDYFELSSKRDGKACKILVLGNSIARHGKSEKIGWLPHDGGMAATIEENDYVHLLFRKTEALLPDHKIFLRVAGFAGFEREFSTFDFSTIDKLISYQPDIIVFQLGENTVFNEVNTPLLFQKKYVDLINCFKKGRNPLIICTTPFFPNLQKNEVIEQVVLATNSYLADLSHLRLLDNQNYAKDEINYAGNKSEWKVDGIGMHPGDYGMRNIAQQIFIIINASIKNVKL
jgi:hypothetical protein